MELFIYSLGVFLLGSLFQSATSKTAIQGSFLRKLFFTKKLPKLIRKTVLVFLGPLSSLIKFSRRHGHRLNSLYLAFTLIIAGPLYSWASEYFDQTTYISCPVGYAIEVHPNHYVACTDINTYWDTEWEGVRLKYLEFTSPNYVPYKLNRLEN